MANRFCEFARAGFSDHHDGQPLSLLRRAAVKLHLSICPACRRYDQSLEATQHALEALKDRPFPGEEKAAPKERW